jgi:hypothetical protein
MTEAEWLTRSRTFNCNLNAMICFLEDQAGNDRRLRLFACACCRRVWDSLRLDAARRLVELAEACADGAATEEELEAVNASVEFAAMETQYHGKVGAGRQFSARDVDALNAARSLVGLCETGSVYSIARNTADDPAADFMLYPESGFPFRRVPRDETEWALREKLLRDIFGNPFRPVAFDPAWRTSTVLSLASQMYESRDFGAMPILADALQDAGCDNEDVLGHCRGPGPHVRGCWVVDLVLGKE